MLFPLPIPFPLPFPIPFPLPAMHARAMLFMFDNALQIYSCHARSRTCMHVSVKNSIRMLFTVLVFLPLHA